MPAVLFVAAATEEEVGCLWSWAQGAHRRGAVLSACLSPAVSAPGTRGVAGPRGLGGRQETSPGAVCALSKAWAQAETV